jgi:hypothetical protein
MDNSNAKSYDSFTFNFRFPPDTESFKYRHYFYFNNIFYCADGFIKNLSSLWLLSDCFMRAASPLQLKAPRLR